MDSKIQLMLKGFVFSFFFGFFIFMFTDVLLKGKLQFEGVFLGSVVVAVIVTLYFYIKKK